MTEKCFHCGEAIIGKTKYQVNIDNQWRPMCCAGCEAVAQTIVASGLNAYYQFRRNLADKQNKIPDGLPQFALYDDPKMADEFIILQGEQKEIILSIGGMSCAACAWLIEQKLASLKGVIRVSVNATTERAYVCWQANTIKLSLLLFSINQLGYNAAPFEVGEQENQYHYAIKHYLYRLGIAGLGAMQVMMLAFAMYFDAFIDEPNTFHTYFRWISLIFSTPVILYCAAPFYRNAWYSLKAKKLVMDAPVSLALLLAYGASFYATLTGKGEVYFESVSMFTFFLLAGRFLEMKARKKAAEMSANLLKLFPKLARLTSGEYVPASALKPQQKVRVLPGDIFPADGVIISGVTTVNEAMLTGEPLPQKRQIGDKVYAGTLNIDGRLDIKVLVEKKDNLMSQIVYLQDAAKRNKPKLEQFTDLIARYFIAAILIIASLTWWYWHHTRPEDAFWIMLSVLVATCPCALSLATPTALTCAASRFAQLGLLIRHSHVIETITKINHLILDKTGTLTEGKITLAQTQVHTHLALNKLLSYATELEAHANHPIAKAFKKSLLINGIKPSCTLYNIKNIIGEGIKGKDGSDEWRIGRREFALSAHALNSLSDSKNAHHQKTPFSHHQIWLSKNKKPMASFFLLDPLRENSKNLIKNCQALGIKVTILTGDDSPTAWEVAKALGVDALIAGTSPEGKLAYLKSLPTQDINMVIGDGINDAPVLAAAHLSVAMGGGTDTAKASADMVLLGDKLSTLLKARQIGKLTQKIIKQNVAWAIGYNLTILPLAVMGYLAPYLAVIGMSASSLIVVTNSLRLLKKKTNQPCSKDKTLASTRAPFTQQYIAKKYN